MKRFYFRLLRILAVSVAVVAVTVSAVAPAVALLPGETRAEQPEAVVPQGAPDRGFSAAWSPAGELWAVWAAADGPTTDLFYSRWTGQAWEPAGSVYAHPATWEQAPSLAFDADGVAWLAWSSSTGIDDVLYLSRWTGRGWSEAQRVPVGGTTSNRQPWLAAAPGGGLWLAWVGFDGQDDEIWAAFWDGRTWSEPQRASGDDTDPAAYDTQPRLAVGTGGDVWLAWTAYEGFLDDEIYAARWDGKRWLPEERVSDDSEAVAAAPSLAVAGDGTVWLAWHSAAAEAANHGRRIFVRRWTGSVGWEAQSLVSSPLESFVSEMDPSLVLDAGGRPRVTWTTIGGAQGVGYATFDGAHWSPPQWAVQGQVAGQVLGEQGLPVVLWWPEDGSGPLPTVASLVEEGLAPLPLAGAPGTPDDYGIMVVPNRHLAFGDSITWGQYVDPATGQLVGDYPARLSHLLNTRVVPSEVINDGVPGEKVSAGRWRLFDVSWPTYQPQFMELLEGTNDITHDRPYNEIAEDLSYMVYYTKKAGTLPFLSTLLPRDDDRTKKIPEVNVYIVNVAAYRKVPLVDNYQAFIDYGNWRALLIDALHPNGTGMQLLADTWYGAILDHTSLVEDTVPPTTWIETLPASSECGSVQVQWNGTDNVSYVVDYDVQAQVNGGLWTDWQIETAATSGAYTGGTYGNLLSFRVRGRDVLGNQSDYSSPKSTTVVDSVPPYDVKVDPLPPYQKGPIALNWQGYDSCTPVDFDVQCSVGSVYNWQTWLTRVSYTSALFDPTAAPCGPAQYGQTYYFRVIAFDWAGRSATSAAVTTVLARYTVDGGTYDIAHQPVAAASVSLSPGVLAIERRPGGYRAYLAGGGTFDVTAARSGYAALPAMQDKIVAADVTGLDFFLPPLDDVVSDGGFEAGVWGDWQPAGAVPPVLVVGGHTGSGAVTVGGLGGLSQLSQTLTVPANLSQPTLSFLVRLEDGVLEDSLLHVELSGTSVSHSQVVSSHEWSHVWLPVDAAAGTPTTLILSVSGDDAVRLDEVSLGSAGLGGAILDLPIVVRALE